MSILNEDVHSGETAVVLFNTYFSVLQFHLFFVMFNCRLSTIIIIYFTVSPRYCKNEGKPRNEETINELFQEFELNPPFV